MLNKIIETVKEAGKIILSAHNQENTITAKEGKKNFVTKYDVAVQEKARVPVKTQYSHK